MPAVTAVVKWFDGKKGYGFATPETGGDDIFVHQLNIPKDADGRNPIIDEGDVIYYDIGEHNGRQTAINVSFPADRPAKPRRRARGRNAKKAEDDEADADADKPADDAVDLTDGPKSNKDVDAAPRGSKGKGKGGGGKGGGGRGASNRTRRNDKGLGGDRPKSGSGPSSRTDKSSDGRSAAATGSEVVNGEATSAS